MSSVKNVEKKEEKDTKHTNNNQNLEVKETIINISGKDIIIQTGKLAKQANGSVTIRCGDTTLLVVAVKSDEPRKDIDFFPLLCDFEERFTSIGRIPGSFNRRENKPPDKSTLTARLMDRPLRPLFPENYYNDVQVVATALSIDQVNPPDTLAMLGASFALSLSNIPFNGPIGAVRVGSIQNKFIANPTFEEIEKSDLDLIVAGTSDSILMVEAGANLVTEDVILNALAFAQTVIKQQVEAQKQFASQYGLKKVEVNPLKIDKGLIELIEKQAKESLLKSMDHVKDKNVHKKFLKEANESAAI
jgi:polyribonucleotide nucleotidyltransferase